VLVFYCFYRSWGILPQSVVEASSRDTWSIGRRPLKSRAWRMSSSCGCDLRLSKVADASCFSMETIGRRPLDEQRESTATLVDSSG